MGESKVAQHHDVNPVPTGRATENGSRAALSNLRGNRAFGGIVRAPDFGELLGPWQVGAELDEHPAAGFDGGACRCRRPARSWNPRSSWRSEGDGGRQYRPWRPHRPPSGSVHLPSECCPARGSPHSPPLASTSVLYSPAAYAGVQLLEPTSRLSNALKSADAQNDRTVTARHARLEGLSEHTQLTERRGTRYSRT